MKNEVKSEVKRNYILGTQDNTKDVLVIPSLTNKVKSSSPCKQNPSIKSFFLIFFVFLQIYCANMGVEHCLSSYITGASLSNDLSMKKILFLHGFFATGSCPMAKALKEAFEGTAVVLTPDLPLHPKEALKEIRSIIDREQPNLLLGNSCGSFFAQMLAPVVGIPALLGNPYFMMTEFLKERIGEHEYKAPRRDGNQRLVIDEALIEEFAELEAVQFDHCNPYYKDRVWGLFGEQETWLTSPLSSCSITIKPSISLAVIRLQSRR